MRENMNKTEMYMEERFDASNNIIDDTGIVKFQDWLHLQWAAQNRDDNMMNDWHETMIRYETRSLLGKTTTIAFKTEKDSPWKFKSGIEEKVFEFKWVDHEAYRQFRKKDLEASNKDYKDYGK